MKKMKPDPRQALKDFVQILPDDEIAPSLKATVEKFEVLAEEIWPKTYLGASCRVFAGMLRAIARQLLIAAQSLTLPIEVIASACRTTFELNLQTRMMVSDEAYIEEFGGQAAMEQESLLKAFMRLADPAENQKELDVLDGERERINGLFQEYAIDRKKIRSVFPLAEACGLAEEYKTLYSFYSKFIHGTPWLVLINDATRENPDNRNIFLVKTQQYALDSYSRIKDFVSSRDSAFRNQILSARAVSRPVSESSAVVTKTKEPGRNDPCPCGSGKKYKKCCLQNKLV